MLTLSLSPLDNGIKVCAVLVARLCPLPPEEELPVSVGSSCQACRKSSFLGGNCHGRVSCGGNSPTKTTRGRQGKRRFDTILYRALTEITGSVKLESEILRSPYAAFDISSSSPCLDCLSQFLCASCGKAEIITLCCAACCV